MVIVGNKMVVGGISMVMGGSNQVVGGWEVMVGGTGWVVFFFLAPQNEQCERIVTSLYLVKFMWNAKPQMNYAQTPLLVVAYDIPDVFPCFGGGKEETKERSFRLLFVTAGVPMFVLHDRVTVPCIPSIYVNTSVYNYVYLLLYLSIHLSIYISTSTRMADLPLLFLAQFVSI